jgi:hypothetical protein
MNFQTPGQSMIADVDSAFLRIYSLISSGSRGFNSLGVTDLAAIF